MERSLEPMSMLTDSKLAVYRPWAWVEIGKLKINYPDGPDEKFSYLKDFKWSIGGAGPGSGVEFTIFDNSPQSLSKDWFSYLRTRVAEEKKLMMNFQWGICGRKQDGSDIGGNVPASQGFYASRIHQMVLTGLKMEYVEGGINYRFNGSDSFAMVQAYVSFDSVKDVTFEVAVQKFIDKLKKDKVLPHDFEIEYDPILLELYPQIKTVRRTWEGQGAPYLLIIQKWMLTIDSERNKELEANEKMSFNLSPITLNGKTGLKFSISNYTSESLMSELDIHVNPPDSGYSLLGTGRHTAVSFRPDMNAHAYVIMSPQISAMDSTTRAVLHRGNSNSGANTDNAGMQSAHYASAPDDPVSTKQQAGAFVAGIAGGAANEGSLFVPMSAEVELLGIPYIDEMHYMGKTVKLTVWNSSYLNLGGKKNIITGVTPDQGGWTRNPPIDNRWPNIMSIIGISHYITTEGVYTTTLKLVPGGSGLDEMTRKKIQGFMR